MTRFPDWQARLQKLANSRSNVPYEYGLTDCWCFARDAIEATTGTVLLPGIAPKGWLSAAKVLLANGWTDIEDMLTALLGEPLADANRAWAGDIVSYEMGKEYHLAVCMGEEALTPHTIGLRVVTRRQWRRAWKVG